MLLDTPRATPEPSPRGERSAARAAGRERAGINDNPRPDATPARHGSDAATETDDTPAIEIDSSKEAKASSEQPEADGLATNDTAANALDVATDTAPDAIQTPTIDVPQPEAAAAPMQPSADIQPTPDTLTAIAVLADVVPAGTVAAPDGDKAAAAPKSDTGNEPQALDLAEPPEAKSSIKADDAEMVMPAKPARNAATADATGVVASEVGEVAPETPVAAQSTTHTAPAPDTRKPATSAAPATPATPTTAATPAIPATPENPASTETRGSAELRPVIAPPPRAARAVVEPVGQAGEAVKTSAEAMQNLGLALPAGHSTAATSSAIPAPAAVATVPVTGLAVAIAHEAQAGKNRFEIRLDPPELGRIHVRLDIDRDGNVSSRLVVERQETLDLLRRDASQLERALQQAGLKTSEHALEFSLRGQAFGRDSETPKNVAHLILPEDDAAPHEALRHGYGRLLGPGGGIDIRV